MSKSRADVPSGIVRIAGERKGPLPKQYPRTSDLYKSYDCWANPIIACLIAPSFPTSYPRFSTSDIPLSTGFPQHFPRNRPTVVDNKYSQNLPRQPGCRRLGAAVRAYCTKDLSCWFACSYQERTVAKASSVRPINSSRTDGSTCSISSATC